uniref:Uncharacterized protein n=1 Tax=Cajanus cajan TaxID=3821 RepID=A0A151UG36_CAJCA
MICDVGTDSFKHAHVYNSFCSDIEKSLYPDYYNFTRLCTVLRLLNLKSKNG